MRIIIDLQACQFLSRFRGIGRYSMSLAQSMAMQLTARDHEVWLLLSDKFPDTIDPIASSFAQWVPFGRVAVFATPHSITNVKPENSWRIRAAEQVREYFIAQIQPDFVHVASLVDGWLDETVTSIGTSDTEQTTAVTLYDLIPYVLPDSYLADPAYKKFYLRKIDSMKRADILFAISEHTRQEAIDLLGFAPEQVINISAAIDKKFRPQTFTQEEKKEILDRYNITKKFVLYVPGGFDPRKNFDRLLEAFVSLPESTIKTYQLVLCSKLHGGEREFIEALATKHGLKPDQFILTDYVPDTDLIALYNLCALHVFPSTHEGFGLPALEAMACGAAVIGSNTTSIPEVIGRNDALFDPYSITSITSKMYEALSDERFNQDLRTHGLIQANKFSWDHSAAAAVSALESAYNRKSSLKHSFIPAGITEAVNRILEKTGRVEGIAEPSVSDIDSLKSAITRNHSRLGDKQLLVDISELARSDAKTGIQRVVRSILLQLLKKPPHGFRVIPVYSNRGQIFQYAHRFLSSFLEKDCDMGSDLPIEFTRGDIFFGLDLAAHLFPSLNSELIRMREHGVLINYVVYDLTPLTHPQWHVPGMNSAFIQWISSLAHYADNLICISQSVAEDVKKWLAQYFPEQADRIAVTYFHLGADINSSVPTLGLPDDADTVLRAIRNRPSFLSVGSIEPRKGYAQLLAAFELLWNDGADVNLIIVGKSGWQVDEIIQRLKSHPKLNSRLFWLAGISDEYLDKIYESAACLIAASEAEGFGLPLIEAAQHKLPIIARDILVFREVAMHHAYYFVGMQGNDIALAVQGWLKLFSENLHPISSDMPWLTWSQSTEKLTELITYIAPTPDSLQSSLSPSLKNRFIRANLCPTQSSSIYELGNTISFTSNGDSKLYVREGWSHSEDWGCWTAHRIANLNLSIIEHKTSPLLMKLLLKAFVNEKHPVQGFDITVNNTLVGSMILSVGKNHNQLHEVAIEIPVELLSENGELSIQLNLPDSVSPLELGMSPDNRLLGVGVTSLQFTLA